jgi:ketosteroid isomerase-like protein
VSQAVQAFNEVGLASATREFFDPSAVFEEPPEQPGATIAHDRASMERLFRQFDAAWSEHRSEIDELRPIDDERVLLLSTEHFKGRDGLEVTQRAGTIFTVRGGKIVRMQPFWDQESALAAAARR